MFSIPTSIYIEEKEYKIRNRGDYRTVLACFDVLSDIDLTEQERLFSCLVIFYETFADLDSIIWCMKCSCFSIVAMNQKCINLAESLRIGSRTNS